MEQEKVKINQKHAMAALAYLGPLVFVPYLTTKNDAFVRFHIRQGFVLLTMYAVSWVLMQFSLGLLYDIAEILRMATMILSVVGIVWVLRNKEQKLPIVGEFEKYFNF